MAKNDDRILQLKQKVQEKKDELAGKAVKFAPVTTMSLELDGVRHNLHVVDGSTLVLLACKLQSIKTSAVELEFPLEAVMLSGFPIDAWLTDIKARLNAIQIKAKQAELNQLESKLKTLLSNDKKTELELDEIAAML
jgi:hypothetical protein